MIYLFIYAFIYKFIIIVFPILASNTFLLGYAITSWLSPLTLTNHENEEAKVPLTIFLLSDVPIHVPCKELQRSQISVNKKYVVVDGNSEQVKILIFTNTSSVMQLTYQIRLPTGIFSTCDLKVY